MIEKRGGDTAGSPNAAGQIAGSPNAAGQTAGSPVTDGSTAEPLDVLCVGFACLDLAMPFSGLPRYDRKHEVQGMLVDGGGPASTASVALHRLGLRVGLISIVGDDSWGQFARRRLLAEGVGETSLFECAGGQTPLSVILADPSGGARTILWNRGTLRPLEPAQVRAAWRPTRLVLVDEIYPEAATEALSIAHQRGVPVLFDAGTAGRGLDELVRRVDFLVTSEHFPSRHTGIDDPVEALRAIQKENGRPVIATRGAKGCWLDDGKTLREFAAPPVEAVDSTGAGDAFHAGLAFGILQGWALERSCRFANYYASQKCRKLGGRAGLLTYKEVQPWIAKLGTQEAPSGTERIQVRSP